MLRDRLVEKVCADKDRREEMNSRLEEEKEIDIKKLVRQAGAPADGWLERIYYLLRVLLKIQGY